jgi:Lar family restriction alleviation protein
MEHKACPFCGGKPRAINFETFEPGFILCGECGACSPESHSEAGAWEKWNKRAEFHKASPLLPCPFCGKLGVQVMRDFEPVDFDDDEGEVRAWCPDCLAYGPDADMPVEAIRKWNIREG